jgi:hypothetical protein
MCKPKTWTKLMHTRDESYEILHDWGCLSTVVDHDADARPQCTSSEVVPAWRPTQRRRRHAQIRMQPSPVVTPRPASSPGIRYPVHLPTNQSKQTLRPKSAGGWGCLPGEGVPAILWLIRASASPKLFFPSGGVTLRGELTRKTGQAMHFQSLLHRGTGMYTAGRPPPT